MHGAWQMGSKEGRRSNCIHRRHKMQIPVDPVFRCQCMCMACHLKDGLVRALSPPSSLFSHSPPAPSVPCIPPLAGCHVCCVPISCTTFWTRCSTNQSKDIVAAIPKALPQTAPPTAAAAAPATVTASAPAKRCTNIWFQLLLALHWAKERIKI